MKILPWLLLATAAHAVEPITLKLWPDGAPGKMLPHSQATDDFLKKHTSKNTITDITDPTIEVFRPERPNGTSVVVAPGGAYIFLSAVHEGTQVCEWLNSIGVTGILLKYRTPTRDEAAPHEKPVQDAAKAIALVREHAKEWNLDPNRVGLLGFSAGGNLLAHLACDRDFSAYPANADQLLFGRPSFGVMIYGGGFLDPQDPTKLKADFTVPFDAPPMFIACAHDDGQNPVASTLLYLKYKELCIPCELHLFTKGGHGFGMRDNMQPINAWPQRCAEWMESMKYFLSLGDINREIARIDKALVEIPKLLAKLSFRMDCGMDAVMLSRLKKQIEEAKANGRDAEAAELQAKHNQLQQAFDAEAKNSVGVKPGILDEDLKRLRREKADLEVQRDWLQQRQSKAKSP